MHFIKTHLSDKKNQNGLFVLLILFLFCLPLFEAPKHLTWFAFITFTLWNLYFFKKYQFHISDMAFIAWFLTAFVTTLHAAYFYQTASSGWHDIAQFLLLGFSLSFLKFDKQKIRIIVWTMILSLFLGLAEGYFNVYFGIEQFLELHSVGHVNHSATYLVLAFSIVLAYLAGFKLDKPETIALMFSALLLFFAIFATNSRAASGVSVIVFMIGLFFIVKKYLTIRKTVVLSSLLMVLVILLAVNSPVYEKHLQKMASYSDTLTARDKINNLSLDIFKDHPILGVGHDNYHQFAKAVYSDALKKGYDVDQIYSLHAHAHHLYYNYLVSSGLVGFSGFIVFFILIIWLMLTKFHTAYLKNKEMSSFVWLALALTLITNFSIGFVNTTLHHEHAMLSMLCIGMFLSFLKNNISHDQINDDTHHS